MGEKRSFYGKEKKSLDEYIPLPGRTAARSYRCAPRYRRVRTSTWTAANLRAHARGHKEHPRSLKPYQCTLRPHFTHRTRPSYNKVQTNI